MNVLFINCVSSNGGDAAILEAAMSILRRAFGPGLDFVVQDDHPQRVKQLYPELTVVSSCYWNVIHTDRKGWLRNLVPTLTLAWFGLARWLTRRGDRSLARQSLSKAEFDYLENYRSADLVVATGGTYLVENYNIDQRVFDMNTAIAMGRPLVLFTQSAGPFKLTKNRRRLARLFRLARLIFLRDERTYAHVRELNVSDNHLRIVPDAAFALADDDLATRPINPFPLAKPRPRIAVSVRQWNYFASGNNQDGMARYCAAFASLTTHLVRRYDADVTFLSTCQGAPGYHDDSLVAFAIRKILAVDVQSRVEVDDGFHTPRELRLLLRTFDWIVATRMHVAILALGVGAPVSPIAYEFKTVELFRSLGYEFELPSIETLSSASLVSAFEAGVENYERVARIVHQRVDHNRQQVWQTAVILRETFPEFAQTAPNERSQVRGLSNAVEDRLTAIH